MIRFKRNELIPILILLLLSFFTWRHIPFSQFQGEGFYYFENEVAKFQLPLQPDIFARFVFLILPSLFQEQVYLYMLFLFFMMLFIDISVYICIRIITDTRLVAFFTTLLFSLSYIGNYDMYLTGGYQYFLQRGVILLPQLFVFTFLILFFNRSSFRYYFLSLGSYFLGLLLGFYSIFFLPVLFFYPLSYIIFSLKNIRSIFLRVFWTPIPYLVGTILIIRHSKFYSYPGEEPFFSSLSHLYTNFLGLTHQLAVLTLPIGGYKWLLDNLHLAMELEIILVGIFIVVAYLGAFLFILKSHPKWSILAATSIASSIVMFLFNLYKNSATVLISFESSRYFYFPFTMVALFWGIFLASIFSSRGLFNKFLVVVFCLLWIFHNNFAIQKAVKTDEWRHNANKVTIEFLQSKSRDLKTDPSYVFLPSNIGPYGAGFAFRYFSHKDGYFKLESLEPPDFEALAKAGVNPQRLYVLHFDPKSQIVVDKTEESRVLLRQLEKKK